VKITNESIAEGEISLTINNNKTYTKSNVNLAATGQYTLTASDNTTININLTEGVVTSNIADNDIIYFTVDKYTAAGLTTGNSGSLVLTTKAMTGGAKFINEDGILVIDFQDSSSPPNVKGDPADTYSADLVIGSVHYIATGNVSDFTSTPPIITLKNGNDTITLDITGAWTTTPTNGSEMILSVPKSTYGNDVMDDSTLSVAELESLITFKPAEDLDTRNTFVLRVPPDYDPSQPNAGGSIDFDLYTYNRNGDVIGVSAVTITDTEETQKIKVFDPDGNEIEVDFYTKLNWDASITPSRLRPGDQATFVTRYAAPLVGRYGTDASLMIFQDDVQSNASLLLEVVSVNDAAGSVEFQATASILNLDGTTDTRTALITLDSSQLALNSLSGDPLNLLGLDITLDLGLIGAGPISSYYGEGDKLVYNISPEEDTGSGYGIPGITNVRVAGTQNPEWPWNWTDYSDDVTVEDTVLNYALYDYVTGVIHFRNFYVDERNGKVYNGDIALTLGRPLGGVSPNTTLATFTACYVGQVAPGGARLRDLDKFWDANGKFMLDAPQTITVTQGDGKRASITLYADDTLDDAAKKLNGAIAKTLGQGAGIVVDSGAGGPFASFVNRETAFTSEAARGTIVVRSAVTGAAGKLSLSGDEDIIKALALNTIQQEEENTFTITVSDAHSGKLIKSGEKTAGSKLIGAFGANIDIVFDPMANIDVSWNDLTKSFVFTRGTAAYRTALHLSDNTATLQIGANEGEEMMLHIGDMSASSLGVSNIAVTDRESSARSVTRVDNAITRVSKQRAKLGAYQNRLEHTVANLTTATTNTVASESRIRDTDMASEMVNFTKLNILSQAANSISVQANQMPGSILSLLMTARTS
jgi:flagellin